MSARKYRVVQPNNYENPETSKSVAYQRGSPHLIWPVEEALLIRGFRLQRNGHHEGLDLAAPFRTPIFAAHDGRVMHAGFVMSGYGRMVLIEYNGQWATLYGHLSRTFVREGQVIRQGDRIGLMGRSGRATGVHLHFEIWRDERPLDPLGYLPQLDSLTKNANWSRGY